MDHALEPAGRGSSGRDVTEPGFFSQVVDWFADAANWSGDFGIPSRLLEHVVMSGVSVAIATALALPLAMYIGHRRRLERLVVSITNLGRAIPSFGLLFLFVLWLGVGLSSPPALRPAIILALVLLAIPPILTNAYVGIQSVDDDTLEAARGMGMSEWSILFRVEVPLGMPLIVAGLRTAAVQVVATATLGAVVAGGGLGRYIIDGFAVRDLPQIFAGAILVAALALAVDVLIGGVGRLLSPRVATRPGAATERGITAGAA
ncbi:MAG TPA: ABC transporter permease [Actinomycetota bacterium]